MKRFLTSFHYGNKGFTLIELLVVIAILGILAAIIVPNLSKFITSGTTEACEIEERMVTTAVQAYAVDNEACPSSIDDLADYFEDPDDIMGSYTFNGTFPACTVTQDECPAAPE